MEGQRERGKKERYKQTKKREGWRDRVKQRTGVGGE